MWGVTRNFPQARRVLNRRRLGYRQTPHCPRFAGKTEMVEGDCFANDQCHRPRPRYSSDAGGEITGEIISARLEAAFSSSC